AGSNPAVSTTSATHLDVAQRKRTGFGSRGLGVRISPSRPDQKRRDQCEVVELVPRLPLKQEVRVRSLASQPFDASAVVRSLKVPTSACCEGGGSFILIQRLRVR